MHHIRQETKLVMSGCEIWRNDWVRIDWPRPSSPRWGDPSPPPFSHPSQAASPGPHPAPLSCSRNVMSLLPSKVLIGLAARTIMDTFTQRDKSVRWLLEWECMLMPTTSWQSPWDGQNYSPAHYYATHTLNKEAPLLNSCQKIDGFVLAFIKYPCHKVGSW